MNKNAAILSCTVRINAWYSVAGSITATRWGRRSYFQFLDFTDKFGIPAMEDRQRFPVIKRKGIFNQRKIAGLISCNLACIMIRFFCQQGAKDMCLSASPSFCEKVKNTDC